MWDKGAPYGLKTVLRMAVSGAALFAVCNFASASPITILNPGFETNPATDPDGINGVSGTGGNGQVAN